MSNAADYETKNGILYINQVAVRLPHPVDKTLTIDDLIIVLVCSIDGASIGRNIFALNKIGQHIWQIQEPPEATSIAQWSYTNIFFNKAGDLIAYNTLGAYYKIDPKNGTVRLWRDPNATGPNRPW